MPVHLGGSEPVLQPRRKPRSPPIPSAPCPKPGLLAAESTGDGFAATIPGGHPGYAGYMTWKDIRRDRLYIVLQTVADRRWPEDLENPRPLLRARETSIGDCRSRGVQTSSSDHLA